MNRLITEIFGFVLIITHIISLLCFVLFLKNGGDIIPDGVTRFLISLLALGVYAIIFGLITTIVTMKDQIVEVKKQLIESNTKMSMFFAYIEEEITKNNNSAEKKLSEATKGATDANDQETNTLSSVDEYVGEWKDGKYHGQGTYTDPSGAKYVGEYKDGEYHGQGTYTFSDGRQYVGEWKVGRKNGQGTFTWADGAKYVGEWKDDREHGQGTYTWPDGTKEEGIWKDGELV
jgi:hypothetical protein